MSRENADSNAMWAAEMHLHKMASGHQNIVGLLEVYFTALTEGEKARIVLIQQLCEPHDLHQQMVYYNDVNIEDARCWMEDLGRALHHIHAHSIIHRDVKPSNCCFV